MRRFAGSRERDTNSVGDTGGHSSRRARDDGGSQAGAPRGNKAFQAQIDELTQKNAESRVQREMVDKFSTPSTRGEGDLGGHVGVDIWENLHPDDEYTMMLSSNRVRKRTAGKTKRYMGRSFADRLRELAELGAQGDPDFEPMEGDQIAQRRVPERGYAEETEDIGVSQTERGYAETLDSEANRKIEMRRVKRQRLRANRPQRKAEERDKQQQPPMQEQFAGSGVGLASNIDLEAMTIEQLWKLYADLTKRLVVDLDEARKEPGYGNAAGAAVLESVLIKDKDLVYDALLRKYLLQPRTGSEVVLAQGTACVGNEIRQEDAYDITSEDDNAPMLSLPEDAAFPPEESVESVESGYF